jgi:hypothetical protein
MNMATRIALSAAALVLVVGCEPAPPPPPPADAEACEHLKDGPAKPVSASATGTGAGAVDSDHTRYDIALADIAGGKGGTVTLASSSTGDHVFFLSEDVPLKLFNSSGGTIPFFESGSSSPECPEVKGRHAAHLHVGTFLLNLGPTPADSVGLVVEVTPDFH